MFRHAFRAALLAGGLLAGLTPALAESSRLALVIGQSAYRSVTPLPNPANDAHAMAKMLGEAGFDVTTAADLSQRDLNREVGDFAAKIASKGPDTVALVFYAGHGLQIDGENYLIPVDVDPRREADIPLQAVRLNDLLNTLNSVPSRMRILLLDACRNNPFPTINQSAGRGLALLDTKSGAPGTFLSYSTSPGAEAEDGNGANSPYTNALLQAAREPGLPIEEAFKRVRVAVNKATEGRQTPWDSSSLTEDFRFIGATDASSANAGPRPAVAKRSVDEWKRSLQGKPIEAANEIIVGDGSVEAYEAFVTLYTAPPYGPQARQWLDLHNRMAAWNEAVLINTVAAYQGFLDRYPDSDLTPTARKLIERLRNRPAVSPVVASANAAIPAVNAAASAGPSIAPTNAALGPTCPCSQTPPVRKSETPKRVEEKPVRKRDEDPPKRASRGPRVRDPDDDVVVYAPPPREYYGPPVRVVPPVNLGIGIGGGYGGGYGRGPANYPTRRGY
ncbi:caspase family protein [Bradyrhizobium ontarionense]|uniref:Caspase family protein n=1 Tax=Bradyrhizobium ontarionense TaxID=2898149 RepID=A0ABY3RBW9_9BRAD|nr:caspase family protein [Bradyrhizobium sp. A19]UFZ04577.1 caspase family protein [Bradyrhizobium sp. A19]